MAAYRADIEIGVRGSSRLKELQDRITRLSRSIEDVNVQTLIDRKAVQSIESYSTALGKASRNLREITIQLDAAGRASGDYADAISQYVTALGQSNAAQKLQNNLIADEIELRRKQKLAASGIRESTQYGGPIGPGPASAVGTLAGQKSPVEERLRRIIQQRKEEAALQEGLLRLEQKSAEELNRQLELRGRLNREAAIAVGTTRQLVAEGNRAQQLLLAPARLGAPAMSGGARRRITGQVERLGGARTKDEAAAALRLAQNIKQQIQPLSQVEALYAGIAVEAAKMQRTKALPSSEMLNAAARGLQQIKTGQDRYNAELAESEERLNRIDRLEESRARRAKKLRDREEYFAPSTSVGAGVSRGGGRRGPGRLANVALGAGFPLLFGGGPGAVLGGGLGGLVPGPAAFAAQIAFSAIGQQLDKVGQAAIDLGRALNPLTFDLQTVANATGIAGTKTEEFLAKIEQYGGKAAAAAEASKLLAQRVGQDATNALTKFGEDAQRVGNEISVIFTRVLAAIAAAVGPLLSSLGAGLTRINRLSGFQERTGLTGADLTAQKFLTRTGRLSRQQREKFAAGLGLEKGATAGQIRKAAEARAVRSQETFRAEQDTALALKAGQLEAAAKAAKARKPRKAGKTDAEREAERFLKQRQRFEEQQARLIERTIEVRFNETQELNKQETLVRAKLAGNEEEVRYALELGELQEKYGEEEGQRRADQLARIRASTVALQEQKRVQQEINNLVNSVGQQFTGLFEVLINGTNDWNSALRNVLTSLSSTLFRAGISALGSAGDPAGQGIGLFSILSGNFGKRANGGPVSAGSPYVVGERGPELFVPGRSGTIVPNDKMGGSRVEVGTINISVENTGEQLSPAAQKQIANQVQGIVMSTLVNERRSGGVLR